MKVLVVYAHPNPESFNHAILEAFTKGLKDGGHTFEVDDLYSIKFDPCFKLEDFAQFTGGQMPKDVLEQQERVARAEALVFIYPVWWYSFPAILRGWFDRVLSCGFAYTITDKGEAEGLLTDKKALLINSTLSPEAYYEASGMKTAMQKIMADAALKEACGIPHVEHVFLYAVDVNAEARKRYLELAYHLGKEF